MVYLYTCELKEVLNHLSTMIQISVLFWPALSKKEVVTARNTRLQLSVLEVSTCLKLSELPSFNGNVEKWVLLCQSLVGPYNNLSYLKVVVLSVMARWWHKKCAIHNHINHWFTCPLALFSVSTDMNGTSLKMYQCEHCFDTSSPLTIICGSPGHKKGSFLWYHGFLGSTLKSFE